MSPNIARIRTLIYSTLLAALLTFTFWDSISSLLSIWMQGRDAYSHGMMNLFISIWLVRKRMMERRVDPTLHWPYAFGLFLLSVLWSAAWFTHVDIAQQLLLPPLILLCIALIRGPGSAHRLLPALTLLYLAIPVWDYLVGALQTLSVAVAGIFLSLVGIEFSVHGFFVSLPNGVFKVAGGCSGLRYLLVSLTLTCLYSYLNLRFRRTRVLLVLTGVLLALLFNWIRVFIIIYLGYQTEMSHPLVSDHDAFGWYLYIATLVPLLIIAHFLEVRDKQRYLSPWRPQPTAVLRRPRFTRWVLAAALTVLVPLATRIILLQLQPTERFVDIDVPAAIADWNRVLVTDNRAIRPEYRGFTQSLDSSYTRPSDDALVSVSIRLYSRQFARNEVISRGNEEFSDRIWDIQQDLSAAGNARDERLPPWLQGLELVHRETGRRHILAWTYLIGGKTYATAIEAKWGQLLALVPELRTDGALIQSSTPCVPDCDAAVQRIADWYSDSLRPWQVRLYEAYRRSL